MTTTTNEKQTYSAQVITDFLDCNSEGAKGLILHDLITGMDSNPLRNTLVTELSNDIHGAIRSKSFVGDITIGEHLTAEEQLQLQKSYPEFNVKFTLTNVNSHGFAAASRKLERKVLLSKIGYSEPTDFETQTVLKEIGGNIVTSTQAGELGLHVCSPILSTYDGTRFSDRKMQAKNVIQAGLFKNHKTETILKNYMECCDRLLPTDQFCFRKSQDCPVKCDEMLAVHSTYDMTLTDLADSMDSASATRLYGSFIYSSEILTDDVGIIPWINAEFKIMRDSNGSRKKINFGFSGCNGFNYEHDYKKYISYVTNSQFISTKGNEYTMELLENRNGIQFFRVVRLQHSIGKPTSFRLYLNHLNDHYIVRFPYLQYDPIKETYSYFDSLINENVKHKIYDDFWTGLPSNVHWIVVPVPKNIIHRLLAFVLGNTEEKFKPEHMANFLRSLFTRDPSYASFGASMELPKALIIYVIAHAGYLYLYNMKYVFGKALQQAIIDIQNLRKNNPDYKDVLAEFNRKVTWLTKMNQFFRKLFSMKLPNHIDPNCFISEPVHYIDIVTKKSCNGKFKSYISNPIPLNLQKIRDDLILTDIIEQHLPDLKTKKRNLPARCDKDAVIIPKKKNKFVLKFFGKFISDKPRVLDVNSPVHWKPKWSSNKKYRAPAPPLQQPNKGLIIINENFKSPNQDDGFEVIELSENLKTPDCNNGFEIIDLPEAVKNDEMIPPQKPPRRKKNELIYAELDLPIPKASYSITEVTAMSNKLIKQSEVVYSEIKKKNINDGDSENIDLLITLVDRIKTGYSNEEYQIVKTMSKPKLPTDVLNRSQAKLRFMIEELPLSSESKVLDLCSGPGGFCVELLKHCNDVTGVFYKDSKIKNFNVLKDSGLKYLEFGNNNLTDPRVLSQFLDLSYRYDLITADGCLEVGYDQRESENYLLIVSELTIGTRLLKVGGTLVVKIFGPVLTNTRKTLFQISKQFGSVKVVRNDFSSSLSLEQYVIFKNRLNIASGVKDFSGFNFSRIISELAINIDKLNEIKNKNKNFVADSEPEDDYPRLGVVVKDLIDVDGSKNDCAFIAAIEDRNVPIDEFRSKVLSLDHKNIELAEECRKGAMGGRAVFETISKFYFITYVIHSTDTGSPHIIKSNIESRIVRLKLLNGHYYIYPMCKRNALVKHRRLNMFSPFNFGKVSGAFKSYFHISIIDSFTSMSENSGLTYLYNNLKSTCTIHDECQNNKVIDVVQFLDSVKFSAQVIVTFELNNFSIDLFKNQICAHKRVGVRFIDIIIEPGYFHVLLHNNNLVSDINVDHAYSKFLSHSCNKRTRFLNFVKEDKLYVTCKNTTCNHIDGETNDYDILIDIAEGNYNNVLEKRSRNHIVLYGRGNSGYCENIPILRKTLENYLRSNSSHIVQVKSVFSNINAIIALLKVKSLQIYSKISVEAPVTGHIFRMYPDNSMANLIKNSMIELFNIWNVEKDTVKNKLSSVFTSLVDNDKAGSVLKFKLDNSAVLLNLVLVEFRYGSVINPPYSWGYSNNGLISTDHLFDDKGKLISSECKKMVAEGHLYVAFASFSKLIHGITLSRLYNVDCVVDFIPPIINFIRGVPGAGKTEYILKNNLNNLTNLILTVTREGKLDMRSRAKRMENFQLDSDRIRTIDSMLLGGPPGFVVDEVWIDEALLVHAGSWFWIAKITNCKKINLIGDSAQIPYYNREGIQVHYAKLDMESVTQQVLSVNRRNPLDIVRWLDDMKFYNFKVTGTSNLIKSVKYDIITGPGVIVNSDVNVYLTFTQAEKSTLISLGYKNTHTIHEFQGCQNDHIVLVRLNIKEADNVYKSQPHILVALTRHRKSFVYYTVVQDKTFDYCKKISNYNDSYITECRHVDLKGGGIVPVVIPESAVVLYKENKIHREIQSRNLETGYVPQFFKIEYELEPIESPVDDSFYGGVNEIQTFIDVILPGSSTEFQDHDHELYEYSSIVPEKNGVITKMTAPTFKKYDHLVPAVRSAIQRPLPVSQKQTVKAFQERNGNVPQLQGFVDEFRLAKNLFDDLKKLFVRFPNFKSFPILPNIRSLEVWLKTQPPAVVNCIMSEDEFQDQDFSLYEFILKKISKIDLELNSEYRYKSPQTIAYQKKTINSVFCPVLRDFMDRVQYCLHPDILLYNAVSPQEFTQLLNDRLPESLRKKLSKFLEIDFSKYDKSQGLLILIFEAILFEEFGVPRRYIAIWILAHRLTYMLDRKTGVQMKVWYQRKSGDPGTWRLNTVVLLAVLNTVYGLHYLIPINECVILVSGDDCLIFLKDHIFNVDEKTYYLRARYNLEAKVMQYKIPYFCSKFLLMTEDGWIFVPDTIKLCVKLGRHDMVNAAHVELYRISFSDNLYYYKFKKNWNYISMAINDRYKVSGEFDYVYSALVNLASSSEKFMKLYSKGRDHIEGIVSTLPGIDI